MPLNGSLSLFSLKIHIFYLETKEYVTCFQEFCWKNDGYQGASRILAWAWRPRRRLGDAIGTVHRPKKKFQWQLKKNSVSWEAVLWSDPTPYQRRLPLRVALLWLRAGSTFSEDSFVSSRLPQRLCSFRNATSTVKPASSYRNFDEEEL